MVGLVVLEEEGFCLSSTDRYIYPDDRTDKNTRHVISAEVKTGLKQTPDTFS
jgi:hypothetical protein